MKMNYFVFGTNNMKVATKFYEALFNGYEINKVVGEGRMTLWLGEQFAFALAEPFNGKPATAGNGTMLGLNLDSIDEVDHLYQKGIAMGGTCEGQPKIRSNKHSAYIRDLDGNKICFYH